MLDANTMRLLSLVFFVRIFVDDVIPKDDGDSLVLSLCSFKLVKSISSSLRADGQMKGLSSPFGLSVNHDHKNQVSYTPFEAQ